MVTHTLKKSVENFKGLDTISSDVSRSEAYSSDMRNAMYTLAGAICKRKGFSNLSYTASQSKYKGLGTYFDVNPISGQVNQYAVAINGTKASLLLNTEETLTMSLDLEDINNSIYGLSSDNIHFRIKYDADSNNLKVYEKDLIIYNLDITSDMTVKEVSDRLKWGVFSLYNRSICEDILARLDLDLAYEDTSSNWEKENNFRMSLSQLQLNATKSQEYDPTAYRGPIDTDITNPALREAIETVNEKGYRYFTKVSTSLELPAGKSANPFMRVCTGYASSKMRGIAVDPTTDYQIPYYFIKIPSEWLTSSYLSTYTWDGRQQGAGAAYLRYLVGVFYDPRQDKLVEVGYTTTKDLQYRNVGDTDFQSITNLPGFNSSDVSSDNVKYQRAWRDRLVKSQGIILPIYGLNNHEPSSAVAYNSYLSFKDNDIKGLRRQGLYLPALNANDYFKNSKVDDIDIDLGISLEEQAISLNFPSGVVEGEPLTSYNENLKNNNCIRKILADRYPTVLKSDMLGRFSNSTLDYNLTYKSNVDDPYQTTSQGALNYMGFSTKVSNPYFNYTASPPYAIPEVENVLDKLFEDQPVAGLAASIETDAGATVDVYVLKDEGTVEGIDRKTRFFATNIYIKPLEDEKFTYSYRPYIDLNDITKTSHSGYKILTDVSSQIWDLENNFSNQASFDNILVNQQKRNVKIANFLQNATPSADNTDSLLESIGDFLSRSPIRLNFNKTNMDTYTFSEIDSFDITFDSSTMQDTLTIAEGLYPNVKDIYSIDKNNTSIECINWTDSLSTNVLLNEDTENCSFAALNNLLYVSNGIDYLKKYDGKNMYRAGIPSAIPESLINDNDVYDITRNYLYLFEYTDNKGNVISSEPRYVSDAEASDANFYIPSVDNDIFKGFDTYSTFDSDWQYRNNELPVEYTNDYRTDKLSGQLRMRIKIYRRNLAGRNTGIGNHYLHCDLPVPKSNNLSISYIINNTGDFSEDVPSLDLIYEPDAKTHDLPPKGKYLTIFKNCLVISGQLDNVNNLQYSLPYSTSTFEIGSEYFPAADNGVIVESHSGSKITGIKAFKDNLYVFHENSVSVMSGNIGLLETPFVTTLSNNEGIGCTSNSAIQELEGQLLFLSSKGMYSIYNTSQIQPFSSIIENLFFNNKNIKRNFKRASTFLWEEKNLLLLNIPQFKTLFGETTDRIDDKNSLLLAYDYDKGSWLRWDTLDFSGGICSINDEILFCRYDRDDNDNSYISKISNNNDQYDYSDNGSSISFYYATNFESAGSSTVPKKFLRLKTYHMDTDRSFDVSGFNLTVNICKDYLPMVKSTLNISILNTFNVGWGQFYWGASSWGSTWGSSANNIFVKHKLPNFKAKSLQLIFENNENNSNVLISSWEYEIAYTYNQEIKD